MVNESAKMEETANFVAGFKPASAQKTSPVKVPAPPLIHQIPPRDANYDLFPNVSGVEEPYSKVIDWFSSSFSTGSDYPLCGDFLESIGTESLSGGR